jgi:hypothetical protein
MITLLRRQFVGDLPSRKLAANAKESCTIQFIYCTYLHATQRSSPNDLFSFVLIWGFLLGRVVRDRRFSVRDFEIVSGIAQCRFETQPIKNIR